MIFLPFVLYGICVQNLLGLYGFICHLHGRCYFIRLCEQGRTAGGPENEKSGCGSYEQNQKYNQDAESNIFRQFLLFSSSESMVMMVMLFMRTLFFFNHHRFRLIEFNGWVNRLLAIGILSRNWIFFRGVMIIHHDSSFSSQI